MLKYLPPARSNLWFKMYLIYAAVITLGLSLYRFVKLGADFDAGLVGRFALLGLAFSGVVHICGYFGGKRIWLVTTAGLIIGLYTLFRHTSKDLSGWEDLATFFSFMVLAAGGFIVGLLVEGIVWLYRYYRLNEKD